MSESNIIFSIIIVNYNGNKYFESLFNSFIELETQGLLYEIIIVDNNSTDGSVKILNDKYSQIFSNLLIVENKKNTGFAYGNTIGVKKSSGKYLIFLNNDTAVDKNWLISIYKKISTNLDIIITAKLLFFFDFLKFSFQENSILDNIYFLNDIQYTIDTRFIKNTLNKENALLITKYSEIYIPVIKNNYDTFNFKFIVDNKTVQFTFDKKYFNKNKVTLIQNAGSKINDKYEGQDIGFAEVNSEKYNHEIFVDAACGASLCIKKDDYLELGGFDKIFFMYYEDTDLSLRARRHGYRILYLPSAIVRHIHTGSSNNKNKVSISNYYIRRNKILFLIKNFERRVYMPYIYKTILSIIKNLIFFPKLFKSEKRRLIFLADISILILLPYYIFCKYKEIK